MAYYRKYQASKTAKREFAKTMDEISEFCSEHGITQSKKGDSYYFTINDKHYRVSNHTIEASDRACYTELGEKIRESYHQYDEEDLICITASKTRIKEIYNDLKAGYELTKRGYRKEQ